MKTLIVGTLCLGLGIGAGLGNGFGTSVSHAESIKEELENMSKTPSKDDTRAELQSTLDRADNDQLQTLVVDYAHRVKVLEQDKKRGRETQNELLKIIRELRAENKSLRGE